MTFKTTMLTGAGVGLRAQHFQTVLSSKPDIPWFELLADNYLNKGGANIDTVLAIREHYPMTLHCVGLSIGSSDPLNFTYLQHLKDFAARIEPAHISDHLCWVSHQQKYLHDLLPLPFTAETITHVVSRIQQAQEYLQRPLLFENLSSYMTYSCDAMSEWEFLNTICKQAGCYLLLDVNNIYVAAYNNHFCAEAYLAGINPAYVKECHLAGYTDHQTYLHDTHNQVVQKPVWTLYQQALQRFGQVPTLIEWDQDIPEWSVLAAEAAKAQDVMNHMLCCS